MQKTIMLALLLGCSAGGSTGPFGKLNAPVGG
jgi:hypothetical protein